MSLEEISLYLLFGKGRRGMDVRGGLICVFQFYKGIFRIGRAIVFTQV
jgi:hypothetical protein